MKKTDVVVVTRHSALVEWLKMQGLITGDEPVIEHATSQDVRGKHVVGVLPLHLAAEAESVTVVDLDIPPEKRGKELSVGGAVLGSSARSCGGRPVRPGAGVSGRGSAGGGRGAHARRAV